MEAKCGDCVASCEVVETLIANLFGQKLNRWCNRLGSRRLNRSSRSRLFLVLSLDSHRFR